ncbi:MAG TPA: hypothetical protein VFH37_01045 [Candidatus Saccharimonadales bacterium]|nr:hypothetical protein [Candidatus Saccharimonadales bacterium]
MRIPRGQEIRVPGAEMLSDNPGLEKAVKLALAVTALAGIYHHFSKNGKGYAYLRPSEGGKFDFEIGLTDFKSGKLERVRALFGQVSPPDNDIENLSDSEQSELSEIENPENVSADEIYEAFEPESETE